MQAPFPCFLGVYYTDISRPQLYDSVFVLQLAAQVLDEFDDEDIGVGVIDAKLDKVVAKKLGI